MIWRCTIKTEAIEKIYKVKLSNRILKQLDSIEKIHYDRIYQKLKDLETNPRPSGCIKLSASEEYRIRIGDYRVIYEINDTEVVVDVFDVLHRKDAYRKKN